MTNLPFMLRLLNFGDSSQDCRSVFGEPRDTRKSRLKEAFNALGRKAGGGGSENKNNRPRCRIIE